jgi:hypothetical protein
MSLQRRAGSWAPEPIRLGVRLAMAQTMLLVCASCAWQEWAVTGSDASVAAEEKRTGLTFCSDGIEFRNQHGYGNGISDLEVSPSGLRLIIRYRWHTFAGPSTKVREWIELTVP